MFSTFVDLPEALQVEALREGEMRLEAQMTVANAADQRALTWAGFLLTGATASLGGGIALFQKQPADVVLGYVAVFFAGAILYSAGLAIRTVTPALFSLPGNRPGLWLPDQWECVGTDEEKIRAARIDQARHLDKHIRQNQDDAASLAADMKRSLSWAFRATVAAAILTFTVVTYREFTIREPTSEFIRR